MSTTHWLLFRNHRLSNVNFLWSHKIEHWGHVTAPVSLHPSSPCLFFFFFSLAYLKIQFLWIFKFLFHPFEKSFIALLIKEGIPNMKFLYKYKKTSTSTDINHFFHSPPATPPFSTVLSFLPLSLVHLMILNDFSRMSEIVSLSHVSWNSVKYVHDRCSPSREYFARAYV